MTSNVFLAGHSIRIEISSSNFPRFDRNTNTGRAIADDTVLKKADQTVYHERLYPSHIVLPIVPAATMLASKPAPSKTGAELTSTDVARYGSKRSPASPGKALTLRAR